jgi:hypothetical protein
MKRSNPALDLRPVHQFHHFVLNALTRLRMARNDKSRLFTYRTFDLLIPPVVVIFLV